MRRTWWQVARRQLWRGVAHQGREKDGVRKALGSNMHFAHYIPQRPHHRGHRFPFEHGVARSRWGSTAVGDHAGRPIAACFAPSFLFVVPPVCAKAHLHVLRLLFSVLRAVFSSRPSVRRPIAACFAPPSFLVPPVCRAPARRMFCAACSSSRRLCGPFRMFAPPLPVPPVFVKASAACCATSCVL